MPSITTLATLTGEESRVLDSPALVAGLTNCTKLRLTPDYNVFDFQTIGVAPSVFAALPSLRTLDWDLPGFASIPPGPTTSVFQPLMGNLESLVIDLFQLTGGAFFSQLQPHIPNLRYLSLREMADSHLPPALFDVTSLEDPALGEYSGIAHIPDGIGRLTGLTRLWCLNDGAEGSFFASVSPTIGSLSRLQSLLLRSTQLISIPAEVGNLTQLTKLHITWAPGLTNFPDCSRLRNIKADRLVLPTVFRPRLRSLSMEGIRGPLPDNMGCMVNLTKLTIGDSLPPALPDSLGELRSLEELSMACCELAVLPTSAAHLFRLRTLVLDDNKLQSCPPLAALRQFRVLDLGYNYLTSLPEGILDLPLLETVSIDGNCLYALEWDVIKRLPLLGSDPMPDTYDPSNERLTDAMTVRARGADADTEFPTIVECCPGRRWPLLGWDIQHKCHLKTVDCKYL